MDPGWKEAVAKAREVVARTRARADGPHQLVGYDVNGIQEYVTANSRPIAMRGASLLIKRFDDEQAESGALFAGGGRGMFLVPEAKARELLKKLPARFAETTKTGVLAVAAAPWSQGDERASLHWLKMKLQAAKDAASPPRDARPGSKDDQCDRCRAYKWTSTHTAHDKTERLCDRCKAITDVGWDDAKRAGQRGLSLNELSRNGYVAAISADGNNMGQLFDALDSLDSVAALSAAVSSLFEKAHHDALRAAKAEARDYVAPISGGDDIRVFLAPGFVEPYVRTLASVIEAGAASFGDLNGALGGEATKLARAIGVGVGVTVASDSTSASWMLQRAHSLEKSAKAPCREKNGPRSAVDFMWLSSEETYIEGASAKRGRKHDQRPVSLDKASWLAYVAKARALGSIPATQRAVLAQQRALGSDEYQNLFRYQVARSTPWQAWYEAIGSDWRDHRRVIHDMPDAGMLELLRMLDRPSEGT